VIGGAILQNTVQGGAEILDTVRVGVVRIVGKISKTPRPRTLSRFVIVAFRYASLTAATLKP